MKSTSSELTKRSTALDGYRAVAIMVVMLVHAQAGYNYPESLAPLNTFIRGGVTAFMVLSGYLTAFSLLQEERAAGKIMLVRFWMRQAIRFYLPTAVYLAIAIPLFGPQIEGFSLTDAIKVLWASPFTGDTKRGASVLTLHLYSVAAQMQYCLLLPILLSWLRGKQRFASFTILMVTVVLVRSIGRSLGLQDHYSFPRTYYLWGSLLVGTWWAVAACESRLEKVVRISGIRLGLIFGLTIIFLIFSRSPSRFLEVFFPPLSELAAQWKNSIPISVGIRAFVTFTSMMGFGWLAFLLHQGRPVRVAQIFAWPGFTWLGRISFSVYLWQNVFCFGISNLKIGSLRLDDFPINMLASVACGYLSYRLVELPSLKLRSWVKQRIRSRNGTGDSTPNVNPT